MFFFVSDKDREGLSIIINKQAAKLSSERKRETDRVDRGERH